MNTLKYHKLVENAAKPHGFWGSMMIKSMNKGHAAVSEWGLSHIKIERNHHVLDVGCGGGKMVERLCKMVGNGKVFGIDYSVLCVEKSENLNQKNILCGKAKIMHSTVSDLPFDDNSFDVVTGVETYYFWPDKLNDLKEISRVLKPNGKLLLVFEMLKTDEDPFKWEKIEKKLNIEAVSEEDIAEMLEKAGYKNIKTYTKRGTSWLCALAEK